MNVCTSMQFDLCMLFDSYLITAIFSCLWAYICMQYAFDMSFYFKMTEMCVFYGKMTEMCVFYLKWLRCVSFI